MAISGVAVEKLTFQKCTEIRSRQDALQTICRSRLDIFYPQICAGFLRFRVFQQPQANSLIEIPLRGFEADAGRTRCTMFLVAVFHVEIANNA
jgi:hypothetical protein